MHVRIDTDARTPTERATAAAVLRAAAELLEEGGAVALPATASEPGRVLPDARGAAAVDAD
jgi:hypothetical protein